MGGAVGRVVYVTQNGLTEALGRRQVLPYVAGLGGRGWQIQVLSFEKAATASREAVSRVEQLVRDAGLSWRPVRYHGTPPILATAFDIARGAAIVERLAAGADLIHARSTVPAVIACLASARTKKPWIFDVRGLLGEEYADAGHWTRGGALHRLTNTMEKRLLGSAAGVVTLTRAIASRLPDATPSARGHQPRVVIPCAADLLTFRPSPEDRAAVRADLGWGDEPGLVYSGSLGSWYRLEEMLDFFGVARHESPNLRFLLLTPQVDLAERAIGARGVAGAVIARTASPDEVPRYLAACDAGLCFLGKHFSKVASSPTKFGEYLATGLPVITNSWIGDAEGLASERPWILVDEFSPRAYEHAARRLAGLLLDPVAARAAARELALREFALETAIQKYHDLYVEVLGR
jgi:glycosyltransferase involved in cell wall biosynthesis